MRSAERISVAFYALLLVAGMIAPVSGRRKLKASAIGLAGILAAFILQHLQPLPSVGVFRDIVPGLFLLVGYWQSGQLSVPRNPRLQASLLSFDQRWFPGIVKITSSLPRRRALTIYLEGAYLLCYPIVPLGIGVLFVVGQRAAVDQFWTIVLPPTFACYACTLLFPTLPPRLIEAQGGVPLPRSGFRSVNLWLLENAGIGTNTLPSGHVASSFAIALILSKLIPLAGAAFLCIAASIAVATVVLRYHYAIDAILGIALAITSFLLLG